MKKDKKIYAKEKCSFCGKIPFSRNPKLIPRHQHLGFGTK